MARRVGRVPIPTDPPESDDGRAMWEALRALRVDAVVRTTAGWVPDSGRFALLRRVLVWPTFGAHTPSFEIGEVLGVARLLGVEPEDVVSPRSVPGRIY